MKTITEMAAEVNEVVATVNPGELILEIESKLALMQHAISENPHHMEHRGFTGVSYLISDVEIDLTKIESLCNKAADYFFFLNNPVLMAEINQAEKRSS